jgi:PEP-CTERM motif
MNKMSRTRTNVLTFAVFGALLLACAVKTHATPTVVATRSGLGSNTSTIDFEGSTTDTSNIPVSLTFLGVTFAGDARRTNAGVEAINGFNLGAPGTNVLTATGNNISDTPADPVFNLVISLPTGTNVVGFDLKNSTGGGGALGDNTPGSYEIYVNGSLFETVATTFGTFSFVGISDTSGITSLAIRALSGGDPVLDNFTFGPAAPTATPEPAALLLLGSGLAGLAALARGRRRKGLRQTHASMPV